MKNKVALILLFLTVAYTFFTQFYHLGELPIVQWDESRLAVNAAEMQQSGNYLVTTFEHKPDLYNTKPPLMIWLQVLSIKCFGLNEWSIRFPSALAGLLCIWLTGFIVYKINKSIYNACITMLILTSSYGFIQLHGSITGDYDAPLTLFLILAVFNAMLYLQSGKVNKLYLFILFVALSVLTKSAAAFIFFPIYAILFYHYSGFNKIRQLVISISIALIPFFVFVLLREQAAGGYVKAMWNNDFGGRFVNGKDGHEGVWYYYIEHLFTFRYNWFIWLWPFAMLWGLINKKAEINLFSAMTICYLFIISVAGTKLEWYDLPILPLIAIVIAQFINAFSINIESTFLKYSFCLVIAVCMFHSLFQKIGFTGYRKNMRLSREIYTISEKIRSYKDTSTLYYYSGDYDAWNYFYTLANSHVKRADCNLLKPGDKIITNQIYSDSIQLKYHTITLDSNSNDKTIRISGFKTY